MSQQPPNYGPNYPYAQPHTQFQPQQPAHPQLYTQPLVQSAQLPSDFEAIQSSLETLGHNTVVTHQQLSQNPTVAGQEPVALQYLYPHLIQTQKLLLDFLRNYNAPDEEGDEGDEESLTAYRNLVQIVQRVITASPLPIPALSALLLGLRPCLADLENVTDQQFEQIFAVQISYLNQANAAALEQSGGVPPNGV